MTHLKHASEMHPSGWDTNFLNNISLGKVIDICVNDTVKNLAFSAYKVLLTLLLRYIDTIAMNSPTA